MNREANWYKSNPSLGITIDIEKVRNTFRSTLENPAGNIKPNTEKIDRAVATIMVLDRAISIKVMVGVFMIVGGYRYYNEFLMQE